MANVSNCLIVDALSEGKRRNRSQISLSTTLFFWSLAIPARLRDCRVAADGPERAYLGLAEMHAVPAATPRSNMLNPAEAWLCAITMVP